jgi:hypothetical protein
MSFGKPFPAGLENKTRAAIAKLMSSGGSCSSDTPETELVTFSS